MKKIIVIILISGIVFGSIGVIGANYLYKASEVSYNDTNVESAINELYKTSVSEYYFTIPTSHYDADVYSYDKINGYRKDHNLVDNDTPSIVEAMNRIKPQFIRSIVSTGPYASKITFDKEGYYLLKQSNSNSISHLNSGDTWTIISTQEGSMVVYLGELNPFAN